MNIRAREVGRSLVITVGGPEEGMTEEERELAEADVVRIVVPPVTAEVGREVWAFYAQILFRRIPEDVEETAEQRAERMTRLALGAWIPDDASDEQRATAEARWKAITDLRWSESEKVLQAGLYWNAQGGGIDVVEALFEDGNPKAQEILLSRNGLWNVYSRLELLRTSPDSASESPAPTDGSPDTNTPSGTSEPGEIDAFGMRRPASETPAA